jgi:small subunit ribosomal protein S20
MPRTKSAKKALRQNARRRVFNLRRKREIKTVIKAFEKALIAKNKETATIALSAVYKKTDKLAKVGFLKKNKAGRIKSRLSKKLARLS